MLPATLFSPRTLPSLVIMLLTLACASAPVKAHASEQCQTLLENKCKTCHFVTYICPRMDDNRGTIYWHRTIKAMVKEGTVLSDDEQSTLVHCLSSRDAQARSFCAAKK